MVEIRSQHMQLRPNSSIFMCVLILRILKTSFRPISKNLRNVQISVKTQKIISQKCSLPKPLGHSEEFRKTGTQKSCGGHGVSKTGLVFEGKKDLIVFLLLTCVTRRLYVNPFFLANGFRKSVFISFEFICSLHVRSVFCFVF